MKLEDQVVGLELAKKLKELGVKQESLFWYNPDDSITSCASNECPFDGSYSTFTVAELGEMLPEEYTTIKKAGYKFNYEAGDNYQLIRICREETEADARAKLLIHLIEEGIIKTDE